jgi:hypothetical protein
MVRAANRARWRLKQRAQKQIGSLRIETRERDERPRLFR